MNVTGSFPSSLINLNKISNCIAKRTFFVKKFSAASTHTQMPAGFICMGYLLICTNYTKFRFRLPSMMRIGDRRRVIDRSQLVMFLGFFYFSDETQQLAIFSMTFSIIRIQSQTNLELFLSCSVFLSFEEQTSIFVVVIIIFWSLSNPNQAFLLRMIRIYIYIFK